MRAMRRYCYYAIMPLRATADDATRALRAPPCRYYYSVDGHYAAPCHYADADYLPLTL